MSQKKAKAEEPAGESAPMWIVSFADLVTLMMSFFVVLYALKTGGPDQQKATAAAIAAKFGYIPPDDSTNEMDLLVMAALGKPHPPMDKFKGNTDNPAKGTEGSHTEVEVIRAGKEIASGATITFETGSAEMDEVSRATIKKIADILRGHTNILLVKGHVSSDELSLRPEDPDGMALSYRRATVAAEMLVKEGIDRAVLRPVACGANEPIRVQVYDPTSLRQNRRVEVFTTDKTKADYFPPTFVPPVGKGGGGEEVTSSKPAGHEKN